MADTPSAAPVRTASMSSFEQVAPPSPTRSADGWGDAEDGSVPDMGDEDGGWDDVDPFDEPKPASLTNIQAAQKRPVSQPKQPGTLILFVISYSPLLMKRINGTLFIILYTFLNS